MSSAIAFIREFYSNLSIHSTSSGGHFLTSWIQAEEFQITKKIVFDTLSMPLVLRLTYPYTMSPHLDDAISLLCGRPISWDFKPRLHSHKLIELNYLLFMIAYHNIFLISHVHIIPIDGVSPCTLSLLVVPYFFPLSSFKS